MARSDADGATDVLKGCFRSFRLDDRSKLGAVDAPGGKRERRYSTAPIGLLGGGRVGGGWKWELKAVARRASSAA